MKNFYLRITAFTIFSRYLKTGNAIKQKGYLRFLSVMLVTIILSSCSGKNPSEPYQPGIDESYEFEIIPVDEAQQIGDISQKTIELQNKRAEKLVKQKGENFRGVHVKTHGCVVADFTINKSIPESLQVGLFSNPGKIYEALIRFSNASVDLSGDLVDNKNESRGMALKVFNVGEVKDMLLRDGGLNNQDFLMINTNAFAFGNVRSYQRLTDALLNSDDGTNTSAAFVEGEDWSDIDRKNLVNSLRVITDIRENLVRNPLDAAYFSAAPSSFGVNRITKFSAEPCGGKQPAKAFEAGEVPADNYLHQALANTMQGSLNQCFDLKLQVLHAKQVQQDRKTTNADLVEDATRVWETSDYPFVNVAKITISAPQEIDLSDPIQKKCESQFFNPWHSRIEHKPLGGINRLRQPVYLNSSNNRPHQVSLEQGWSKQESDNFHHTTQGANTFKIPIGWFLALEQPDSTEKFSDSEYLATFGFIPSKKSKLNPYELPIGFVGSTSNTDLSATLGLTCAACHTGKISFKGKDIIIDGGAANINLSSFKDALENALILTQSKHSPERYLRFEKQIFGVSPPKEAKKILKQGLANVESKKKSAELLEQSSPFTAVEEGFSRLDALNGIGNALFKRDPVQNESNHRPSMAPVNFPHIWSTSWFDWIQYDASIMQPMTRNAGEALGLGALIDKTVTENKYDSSIHFENLYLMETLLAGEEHPLKGNKFTGLTAPKWPEDILGEIVAETAMRGKVLYKKHCVECHRPAVRKSKIEDNDEFWSDQYWPAIDQQGSKFYSVQVKKVEDIGTDPAQSRVLAERTVDISGLGMEGEVCTVENGVFIQQTVTSSEATPFAQALGLIVEKATQRFYNKNNIQPELQRKMNGERPNCLQVGKGYKARPLNGIWATPPYLHNSSVATLYELLSPRKERASTLYLGTTEFDPMKVGYKSIDLPHSSKLVVSGDGAVEGNFNSGHEFTDDLGPGKIGPKLTKKQRVDLVEYLKTL